MSCFDSRQENQQAAAHKALQVRTVISKYKGQKTCPNLFKETWQYIGSDQKNSNVLMSCFDSRREKQQAAAQGALRVRTVIPKAKGHYWLFSGDKERTRKRPECRWYVLVRVRSCDSSTLIRCTPILIWSSSKESAICSIVIRE